MRYRRLDLSSRISMLVTFLGLFGSAAGICATPFNGDFIERPGKDAVSEFRQSLHVRLSDGGSLRFIEIPDTLGATLGFLVVESKRSGASGISQHVGLREISPVDLMWAVTEPGEQIPDLLRSYFGAPDPRKSQGWARPLVGLTGGSKGGTEGHCNEQEDFASFADDIYDFGYGLVFLSEDDGPQSQPQHWFDEPYEDDALYSRLTGAAYDVSAFYAQVKLCFLDDYAVPEPQEPWWGYDYRAANGQWENIDGGYFDGVGNEDSFWWHPVEHTWGLEDTPEIDFRIRVGRTLPGTLFWIGATWSKPFDTLTGN